MLRNYNIPGIANVQVHGIVSLCSKSVKKRVNTAWNNV